MEDKKLKDLLEQLHNELEHTANLDDKGRALLRDLDADIRQLLDGSAKNVSQSLVLERLEDSIKHLEITHPTLTMALSELLTALNNAGI
jgi:hypothetical protein